MDPHAPTGPTANPPEWLIKIVEHNLLLGQLTNKLEGFIREFQGGLASLKLEIRSEVGDLRQETRQVLADHEERLRRAEASDSRQQGAGWLMSALVPFGAAVLGSGMILGGQALLAVLHH